MNDDLFARWNVLINTTSSWYEDAIRQKADKAVITLRADDGTFIQKINIPSIHWPLNGPYRVFTCRNTEPLSDERALQIFDQQVYRQGRCYSNTESLTSALRNAGYDARSYVGWLFTCNDITPIHHCWTVLNGIHVLDLMDDEFAFRYFYTGEPLGRLTLQQSRVVRVLFVEQTHTWRNQDRCFPVGSPFPQYLYVGCECDPEDGKAIYRNFARSHPEYERATLSDSQGRSAFQQMLAERGLMD